MDYENPSGAIAFDDGNQASNTATQPSGLAPVFTLFLVFVGLVSAYDGYLVVRTGEAIHDFEKNPVGLYLIECNNGNPSIFLRVKAAGTLLVLAVLSFLHHYSQKLANPIAFGLVLFQAVLLIFLERGS